jgi:hypothetical protein
VGSKRKRAAAYRYAVTRITRGISRGTLVERRDTVNFPSHIGVSCSDHLLSDEVHIRCRRCSVICVLDLYAYSLGGCPCGCTVWRKRFGTYARGHSWPFRDKIVELEHSIVGATRVAAPLDLRSEQIEVFY